MEDIEDMEIAEGPLADALDAIAKAFRPLRWHERAWRKVRYWWQRRTRGFSDDVTWSLDAEIAKFIAPRLKRFKELNNGFPGQLTSEKWDEILDEMIWAFEFHASEESSWNQDSELYKRAQKGLKLFGYWFPHLWW